MHTHTATPAPHIHKQTHAHTYSQHTPTPPPSPSLYIHCDIEILYSESIGDHIPFRVAVSTECIPILDDANAGLVHRLDWSRLNRCDIDAYTLLSDMLLSRLDIPVDAFNCKSVDCTNVTHVAEIKEFYTKVTSALRTAEIQVFAERDNAPKGNARCRPGWSDYVDELHGCAREFFILWRDFGKPRQGQLFDLMQQSRTKFKYAMRAIKRRENALRCESLAKKMSSSSNSDFWKEIKAMNNANTPLPSSIDGVTGRCNIAEVWREHFCELFNSINDSTEGIKCNCVYTDDMMVSIQEVDNCIQRLKLNKACGLDGVSAEHLKNCGRQIIPLLAMCLTGFMVHGFLPEEMMSVCLIPVIKDKRAKINNKDNYRPVAIASIVSKVLEMVLLDRLSEYLDTNSNQFGFKQKLGTDMCIYAMKEIIASYSRLNGNVFTCFLDASKAFDRVKHSILFKKLLIRGVPGYIVRLLMFWYSHQSMGVKWGGSVSTMFNVSNGVRQGGILSPYLFIMYMDDLSVNLNRCPTGCIVGNTIINHIMYADDIVLLCPSAIGLCYLLDECEKYGLTHDIKYNSKKSAIVVFRNSFVKNTDFPSFQMNGESIKEVPYVKYLGHFICASMKDDMDILRQCRQLYAQGNVLARRFHMCSDDVKLTLFRSYCSSLYTAQTWWKYTVLSFRKLCVAYNNVFRMLFKLPRDCSASEMFVMSNVPSCPALLRKLVFGFYMRVQDSLNTIVQAICGSDVWWNSRLRWHWIKLLYVHLNGQGPG